MSNYKNELVWIDLEMTGLDPELDTILEISTVITNNNLDIIEVGPSLVINHSEIVLSGMNEWCVEHHGKSGLTEAVRNSKVSMHDAQAVTLEFLKKHCTKGRSPLCGNSVWQDRIFLRKDMPEVDAYLNYRIIDVSSIKEVVRRWYDGHPQIKFEKSAGHRASEDILASIEELKHYRYYFFFPS